MPAAFAVGFVYQTNEMVVGLNPALYFGQRSSLLSLLDCKHGM